MWQQRLFMKELADWPKDREFLRHFESRAAQEGDDTG